MKNIKNINRYFIYIFLIASSFMLVVTPLLYENAKVNRQSDLENAESIDERNNKVPFNERSATELNSYMIRSTLPLYAQILEQEAKETPAYEQLLENPNALTIKEKTQFSYALQQEQAFYETNFADIRYYVKHDKAKEPYTNDKKLDAYLRQQLPAAKDDVWFIVYNFDKNGIFTIQKSSVPSSDSSISENAYPTYDELLNNHEMGAGYLELPVLKTFKSVTFVFEIEKGMIDSSLLTNTDSNEAQNIGPMTNYLASEYNIIYIAIIIFLIFAFSRIPYDKLQNTRFYQRLISIPWEVTISISFILIEFVFFTIGDMVADIYLNFYIGYIVNYALKIGYYIALSFLSITSIAFIMKECYVQGSKNSIRKYSIIYRIIRNIKQVLSFDFNEKSMRTLMYTVIIHVVILAILCMMWIVGIFFLVIYGLFIFFYLAKRLKKAQQDMQNLHIVTNRLSKDDFRQAITEELGMFEPFKNDLQDIQTNIEEAITKEVISQKMKTELITNVSHDLKTPLTSIISYIDLLKNPDLSKEDQLKYIATADKSSERLKHLIEDLFEISKANSGNVNMNYMSVNIISLMNQVQMECDQAFHQNRLQIINQFSDEKIMMLLDPQKTFRIFENLLSNVSKYALPKTRVFIEISDFGELVDITIKNISAAQLNFSPEEITERFMRGDKSRNTEGSGLGLSITKSFVELQNGSMHISFDGDMFKVHIRFMKKKTEG